MQFIKTTFIGICICWMSFLYAQNDHQTGADSVSLSKKPLILSFGLDVKVKSITGGYDHNYTGEYNKYGSPGGGWEWVNHRTTFNQLLLNSEFTDIKLSVMGATNRNFKIGLGYNFGSVSGIIPGPVFDSVRNPGGGIDSASHNIVYAGICASTEYDYYLITDSKSGVFAFGAMDLGFYTGTDDVFGPGIPFFVQGKLGMGYCFKNKVLFRAFAAMDQLIYHENSDSQVYHKQQTVNINLNAWYIGVGIIKVFTIFPD